MWSYSFWGLFVLPVVPGMLETPGIGATAEVIIHWIPGGNWRQRLSGPQLVPLQINDRLIPDSRDQRKRAENPRQRIRVAETEKREEGAEWAKRGGKKWVHGVRIQMHCSRLLQRRVCGGLVCLWSPRTCRLAAAGCGSQLSGELTERREAR